MIDNESIKYITFYSSAQEITNIIMNNLYDFPCPSRTHLISQITPETLQKKESKWKIELLDKRMKKLVITEMTAGVGGNVLNFAKHFKYVNAIELNNIRYKYLSDNIKLYGHCNVNCYNDNSVSLLIDKDDLIQDIVFFDPPWGGENYKFFDKLRLSFGNYSVEIICLKILERICNKMIVLKLPTNYDFDFFTKELSHYKVNKYTLNKMVILVVKSYSESI